MRRLTTRKTWPPFRIVALKARPPSRWWLTILFSHARAAPPLAVLQESLQHRQPFLLRRDHHLGPRHHLRPAQRRHLRHHRQIRLRSLRRPVQQVPPPLALPAVQQPARQVVRRLSQLVRQRALQVPALQVDRPLAQRAGRPLAQLADQRALQVTALQADQRLALQADQPPGLQADQQGGQRADQQVDQPPGLQADQPPDQQVGQQPAQRLGEPLALRVNQQLAPRVGRQPGLQMDRHLALLAHLQALNRIPPRNLRLLRRKEPRAPRSFPPLAQQVPLARKNASLIWWQWKVFQCMVTCPSESPSLTVQL